MYTYFSWAIIYVNLARSSPQVHVSSGTRARSHVSATRSPKLCTMMYGQYEKDLRGCLGASQRLSVFCRDQRCPVVSAMYSIQTVRGTPCEAALLVCLVLCTLYIYSLNEPSSSPIWASFANVGSDDKFVS